MKLRFDNVVRNARMRRVDTNEKLPRKNKLDNMNWQKNQDFPYEQFQFAHL